MKVTIVGAGAGGLVCSILLAKKGVDVVLVEKEKKTARKLRATGNGKCNITNTDINVYNYSSNTPEFIDKFILPYKDIKKVFLSFGIPFKENADGRVFPLSMEANAVADKLEYTAKLHNVEIIKECEVLDISKQNDMWTLETEQGVIKSEKLILAAGHKAGRCGGDDRIIQAVKKWHTVYDAFPSLVQLKTGEDFTKCSGVKIKSRLFLYSNGEFVKETYGDLLFTHYGISGLAVLDISRDIAKRVHNYEYLEIKADFFPETKDLKAVLKSINGDIHIGMILRGVIPARLIPFVLKQAGIESKKGLTPKDINKLNYTLKNYRIEITGTKDFKNAEVVSGGVSIAEVNPETMESRKIKNLYFIGEMLDVDGDRGGYNLHFAWGCALKAARNIT